MIFDSHARNAFIAAVQKQDAIALGFIDASQQLLETLSSSHQENRSDRFGAMCVLCLVNQYPAEDLISEFENEVAVALGKANLGQALWAMIGAMIFDCLEDTITDEQRQRLYLQQALLVNVLLKVGKGNPHIVTNNWWGVTHSALVLAVLCLPASLERDEILSFASNRLRAFLHHFGPACLYHEGLGYQDYTLSQVLPALFALEAQQLFSFEKDFPQSKHLGHSLLMASALVPALQNQPDKTSSFGGALSWNDAGHAWPASNVAGLSIHLSKDASALWTWFLKLAGPESLRKSFAPHRCGLYYNAMLYPYKSTPIPVTGLPTHVLDTRQGLFIFRTQWKDADDLVVGVYARATHVGGHTQDDAGSLRVIGMGYDWILGGGQNRPQAEWQSVAVPRGEIKKNKAECGAILYEEIHPDSFTLGLELRKARGAYCERYVHFFTPPDDRLQGALLLLDHIDEHRDIPWSFQLTLSPQHRILEHETGITLIAPDHSCMHLHFFTAPMEMSFSELPDTSRTFASGHQEVYRRFPVLSATFSPRKHLSIYTLISFSKAGHLPEIVQSEGLGFSLDGHCFDRPFASAVSPKYVLNESKGLCQDPLYHIDIPK